MVGPRGASRSGPVAASGGACDAVASGPAAAVGPAVRMTMGDDGQSDLTIFD